MNDWQQRVVNEKEDLDKKRRKLGAFFDSPAFGNLSMQSQIDLQMQYEYMGLYSDTLERRIKSFEQKTRLTAPRLSPDDIDDVIIDENYTIMPSGKVVVCELTLRNGFTVRGDGAAVSKENFRMDIGSAVAYENAREKIWQLEGYLLQQRLYEEAK